MSNPWTLSFVGLPAFLTYFAIAIALLLLFGVIYTRLTAHDEFALIRQGKSAAAVALGGSLVAFVLPLCSAIIHSVSLVDFVIWGLIALAIQIATFFAVRILLPNLSQRISNDEMAAGLFVALTSIAVGAINAACMTP
jgi:putative membrane protein